MGKALDWKVLTPIKDSYPENKRNGRCLNGMALLVQFATLEQGTLVVLFRTVMTASSNMVGQQPQLHGRQRSLPLELHLALGSWQQLLMWSTSFLQSRL